MDFSVVIPTYRRSEKLRRCLECLAVQTDAPSFEVLVVFDGPEPAQEREIRVLGERLGLDLSVLSRSKAGPAAARNLGSRHARGHRILYLGDDIMADPHLLAEHAVAARRRDPEPAVLGFVPWAEAARPTRFMRFLAPDHGPQFHFGDIADPDDCGFEYSYTANFAIPRDWWLAEPFDEDFPHAACEDLEWAWRLEKRGGKIVYAPKAIGRHDHHVTLRQFIRRQAIAGTSAALVWHKQPELRTLTGLFPPSEMFFSTPSGRGLRDRLRQAGILARHYTGLPVSGRDYLWLVTRRYLGALHEALGPHDRT